MPDFPEPRHISIVEADDLSIMICREYHNGNEEECPWCSLPDMHPIDMESRVREELDFS